MRNSRQNGYRCMTSRSDRDLVHAAAAGDAEAWDTLVERHMQPLWTTLIDRGLDRGRAAEVCAITWLRCADHLVELTVGQEVGDWLLTAAGRECDRGETRPSVTGISSYHPFGLG